MLGSNKGEDSGTNNGSISTHIFRTPTETLDDLALHLKRIGRLGSGFGAYNEWSCVSHDLGLSRACEQVESELAQL